MPGLTADFLVIGGGVVGLTVALEAKRRHPGARVVVLEKEASCGEHASGRNSGVLHAGFYYPGDSLKARFAVEGNRRLTRYCLERELPIRQRGKLVVARDDTELEGLDRLLDRGRGNGVTVELVSARRAREIEPRARTFERALWSPATAAVDPRAVMRSLVADAGAAGVEIRPGTAYVGRAGRDVRTSAGTVETGYLINAAGLYADRIARDFGFARHHRILPFKGVYLVTQEAGEWLGPHIYPVPDLGYPFLGVHLTVAANGGVKVGPTASPALWRESYGGLANFRAGELARVGSMQARLLARNAFQFRKLAWRETRKRFARHLLQQASRLVRIPDGARWKRGRPGMRAQLVDTRSWELEMDFRLEADDRSLHVLNAVSPAFTCALPFADFVLDEIERRLSGAKPTPRDDASTDQAFLRSTA